MLLRFALVIGAVSQTLLASDFSPGLFPNQSTGSPRELSRQALDRQIGSALLGKQPAVRNPLPLIHPNPLLNGRAKVEAGAECSIPLTRIKIDKTKQFAIKAWKIPKSDFNSIAKALPVPACEH